MDSSRWRALRSILPFLGLYLVLAWAGAHSLLPWCDEGWFSDPAWNLMHRGVLGNSILDPTASFREVNLAGIDRHAYWIMPLYVLAQVPWYKLAGFGLMQMRLLSALWGLPLLLAWWFILSRLAPDPAVAPLAVTFLAVDFNVINAASAGRMDMMVAALGACGVALFLSRRESSLPQALFLGFAATGCACLTHPNAVFFAADVLFLAVYFDRAQLLRWRSLAAMIAPVALALAGWGLYISGDPRLFAAQFLGNAGGSQGRFLAFFHPLQALRNELVNRYFANFGMPPHSSGLATIKLVVLFAWFASAAAFFALPVFRRKRGYRAIMGMFLIHVGLLLAINGNQLPFYTIYVAPLWIAVTAAVVLQCWRTFGDKRWLVAVACAAVMLVNISVTVGRFHVNPYRNRFLPALAFLRPYTDSGSSVMASSEVALGLGFDRRVIDDYRLGYRSGKRADFIVLDEARYQPWIELLAHQDPANYNFIQGLLKNYHVVYDRPGYRIYRRAAAAD